MNEPVEGAHGATVMGGAEGAAYRRLLSNRPFRNLALAGFASSLGDWIGVLAILALTESILGPTRAAAFALSGVMVARVLPTLALGPVAGVFVDRWDRKRTMIVTDIGRGLVMAVVPFSQDVLQLFVATLIIEVFATMFGPAKDATVPNLVHKDRLVHANQLSLMVTYGTLPLGGVLFALLAGASTTLFNVPFLAERPAALAIWLNAGSFFASALLISRIDIPRGRTPSTRTREQQPGAWDELTEGFRFIAHQPLIRALILGVMGAFFAAGIVMGPGKLFATISNAGESGFGALVAAVGIGLFLGLLMAARLAQRFAKERLFAPGIAVAGLGLIVLALMPRIDLAMLPAVIMGGGAGVGILTGYTLLQERVADEIRGRTFAAFNTGVRAALFASLVLGPLLVGTIGIESVGPDGVYPYSVGGVRITLLLGGFSAIIGAVITGRSIHRVLTRQAALKLDVGDDEAAPTIRAGAFIVFEGGEGAGKSTQIQMLRRAIETAGYEVIVTREPGGTEVGEALRALLLDPATGDLSFRAEALMYAAARAQHVHEVITPALGRGTVVLCDRYIDSSVIYQGDARGLGEEQIAELNRWATIDLRPDLTILLDIDAREGLRRAGSEPDRLEAVGLGFHERVNAGFRARAAADPGRYLVLDGAEAVDGLHDHIRDVVLARLQALVAIRNVPGVATSVMDRDERAVEA